jgi:hypothetical protein
MRARTVKTTTRREKMVAGGSSFESNAENAGCIVDDVAVDDDEGRGGREGAGGGSGVAGAREGVWGCGTRVV